MPHAELELGLRDELIGPKTSCSPCYNNCSNDIEQQCMTDITVDEVADRATLVLAMNDRTNGRSSRTDSAPLRTPLPLFGAI